MASTKEMQARAKQRKALLKPPKQSKQDLANTFQKRAAYEEALTLEAYIKHPGSIVHYYDIDPERIAAEKASPLRTPTMIGEGVLLKVGTGKPLHCSQNVLARLREDKTLSYALGIIRYQNPHNLQDHYEGHVVIKHPNGMLEDVTGRLDDEKLINFIPI